MARRRRPTARAALVLLSLPLFAAATASLAQAPPQLDMRWPEMARKVVERLALEPGERVLAVSAPGVFEELVPHLRYEVMRAGGVDLGVVPVLSEPAPEAWSASVLATGAAAALEAYRDLFDEVDAAIMMPGASPQHPAYAALQDRLRVGRGRTVHFHWTQTTESALALPGQPLPPPHEIDRVYLRALLETDYDELARVQRSLASALRAGELRVTSPLGTDLRLRVGDRPVNLQDGDASAARADRGVILIDREIELPAGAIRVAPLEETVEGVVAFPPSQWDGRAVEGLVLRFERGRVVEVSAARGRDAALAEMEKAGPAGRAFREIAIGLNPLLAVPERFPWIPYYGYGAGVVRLSLGDNSELGGAVGGGYVRWSFFTDTTVTVGGEVWIAEGRLRPSR
ncbi:MAG TPA: aminopeptidase [Thermoanaerobaculia bacterium]|nr:aminopeptidase [Thermoanaerobaculia bacterium]